MSQLTQENLTVVLPDHRGPVFIEMDVGVTRPSEVIVTGPGGTTKFYVDEELSEQFRVIEGVFEFYKHRLRAFAIGSSGVGFPFYHALRERYGQRIVPVAQEAQQIT